MSGGGAANACPHCGRPAVSAWRKLSLGPAARAPCRSCGQAVGVAPLPALASFVPCVLIVVLVTSRVMTEPVTMVLAAAAAIGSTCGLYLAWVPLVRRGLSRPSAP